MFPGLHGLKLEEDLEDWIRDGSTAEDTFIIKHEEVAVSSKPGNIKEAAQQILDDLEKLDKEDSLASWMENPLSLQVWDRLPLPTPRLVPQPAKRAPQLNLQPLKLPVRSQPTFTHPPPCPQPVVPQIEMSQTFIGPDSPSSFIGQVCRPQSIFGLTTSSQAAYQSATSTESIFEPAKSPETIYNSALSPQSFYEPVFEKAVDGGSVAALSADANCQSIDLQSAELSQSVSIESLDASKSADSEMVFDQAFLDHLSPNSLADQICEEDPIKILDDGMEPLNYLDESDMQIIEELLKKEAEQASSSRVIFVSSPPDVSASSELSSAASPATSTSSEDSDSEWSPVAQHGTAKARRKPYDLPASRKSGSSTAQASPDTPRQRSRRMDDTEKRERKKLQNKNAATKYRVKKKEELEVFLKEEDELENKNKELREKYDKIATEIKYLKGLMKEVLKMKGVIK